MKSFRKKGARIISVERARPEDLLAMKDICIRTADQGHDPRPKRAFPEFLSDIWLTPYMRKDAPTICLVARADGGSGKIVGYCIAAVDAHAFEEELTSDWYPVIRNRYRNRTNTFTPADAELWKIISSPAPINSNWLKYYPAEVHIDIVPEGQRLGLGRRLIEAMSEELRELGVEGFFLGVDPLNKNAQGFYKHMGYVTILPKEAGGPIYGVALKN